MKKHRKQSEPDFELIGYDIGTTIELPLVLTKNSETDKTRNNEAKKGEVSQVKPNGVE